MTKKWIKRIGLTIFLTPIILILLTIILLYIPPIQNYLRKEVTAYASSATGMQIHVERIDLRFPLKLLVRGVEVVQAPDTILALESLSTSVKVFPLFRGRAELDDITLNGARFNTANLLDGMHLTGVLDKLSLQSNKIDLSNEIAQINHIELSDTHIQFLLNDTTESPVDTTQTAVNWQAKLGRLTLNNVSFTMQMPADSMQLATQVSEATIQHIEGDLRRQFYGLERLTINRTSANYDKGASLPVAGFDPSHIALRDINIGLDSVYYGPGMNINAVIREMTMNERSGLSVSSLNGSVRIDSLLARIPELRLTTPHSELNLTAQAYWDMTSLEDDRITAELNARIGKQDVMLFGGSLPDAFKQRYPSHPLTMQLNAQGNIRQLHIPRLAVNLPGAFSLSGGGEVQNITDSLNRTGTLELQLHTQDLSFLTAMTGMPDTAFVIPPNIVMALKAGMRGPQYNATLRATESTGVIHLDAAYNMQTEVYSANLDIDSLEINHFLPKDSIYTLAATAVVRGQGTDFTSSGAVATVDAAINRLEYASYQVDNIHVNGELRNAVASAHITSDNDLLVMQAEGNYALNTTYTQASAIVDVTEINLYELGVFPDSLRKPISFHLDADLDRDSVSVTLNSGDLLFRLRSRSPVETLISESTGFIEVLNHQIEERRLNHTDLRRALPSATIRLNSGTDNPLYYYMAMQNVKFKEVNMGFVATPRIGINGRAAIDALQIDTLRLDTVYFSIRQDTARMSLRGGVVNSPNNPQIVFKASLNGEIRSEDAELTLQFENGKGETGLLLGVNARPQPGGMMFNLIPENPIVAFREFRFNGHNTVFLRNNYRVLADVQMLDPNGMGVIVRSMEEADTTYLQNLDIEIRAIDLADVSEMLPYLPEISGQFFLEANYRQSAENRQVSAEGHINQLFYENNRVGNIGLGATWLPADGGRHYLNGYLNVDGTQAMTADGTYETTRNALGVNAEITHFPLYVANAFIPDEMVELMGDLDGRLTIDGTAQAPQINGELMLDSVTATSTQYGFNFHLDNRPLQINNSRLTFDQFAIYTTSENPFTVNGYVDFANLSAPMADLALLADNYQLLNAPRTANSMLYGQVLLNLNSTIRGPLSGLVMRGDISLLDDTDVTYVLTDSPLSVQDRLGDLVEFVSFSDTVFVQPPEETQLALGGLDILMSIHIDPAAQVQVDLNADRSSRIELQGGGDLAFQYTPQGEMSLSGRYTLVGGMVKYSLPVIPLKEFTVNEGSYVEFSGNPMDPNINFKATERMRVNVPNDTGNGSRMVDFDVSLEVKNRLNDLELMFNLEAPEDADVQRQLAAMDDAERSKQAITLMATGMYLAGGSTGTGDFNMGAAFNSLLQSQIASLAGSALKHANITFGMDNYDGEDGGKRTDYNFRYSQRLFDDRVQVVIGGTISSGQNAEEADTFIDNVSLEYRLDRTGTRYVRLFHNKEYENILESNITETGGGLVLRKKVNKLGELFIFRRRNK